MTYEAPFNAHYFAFQSLNGFRYYWNPIALPGQKYQVDFSDMSELREQISLELPLMDYAHVQLYGLRDNLHTPYRIWENYSGFITPPSSFTLYYPTDLFRHFLLDLDIAVSASYNVRFVRIDAEPVDLDFAYPEWDIARPTDNVFTIEGIYDAYQLEYAYILAGDPVLNWKVYGAPRPEIIPRRPKIPQDFRLTFPEEQIKLLSVGMLDLPGTDGYAAWVSAMLAKGKRRNIADSGPWLLMNRRVR